MTIPPNTGSLGADYSMSDEDLALLESEEVTASIQKQVADAKAMRLAEEERAFQQQAVQPDPQVTQPTQPPQGEQQQPQEPQAESTDQPLSGETVTFNNGKTYAVEHIEYINGNPFVKREFRDLYKEGQAGYLGQDLGEFNRQVRERTSSIGQGLFDFATEAINMVLPKSAQIPKASKYEDNVAQATRQISSVVIPTIMLQGVGMQAGAAAQSRVGWSLGNTAFMRFLGARGVEAASAATVGAVSAEYEGENLTGSAKKTTTSMGFYPR